jgi:hypothetical protein
MDFPGFVSIFTPDSLQNRDPSRVPREGLERTYPNGLCALVD